MKLQLINTPSFDLWYFRLNKNCVLCIYFYTFKHLLFLPGKLFDFFSNNINNGRQVTGLVLPLLYIQLITPVPLIWVNEDDLFNLSINTLKDKANDLEDIFADYLLGYSEDVIEYIDLAEARMELSVLYQVINFYKEVE